MLATPLTKRDFIPGPQCAAPRSSVVARASRTGSEGAPRRMRDIHSWNLLALHVPNLLPRQIPFPYHGGGQWGIHNSVWIRHAGRLIWATILFTIGIIIAVIAIKRPKKTDEPATWVASFLGAMYVWAMFALGYGVIPHEWLNFGTAYLNFDSSSFALHKNSIVPFDVTRDKIVDAGAAGIYVVVLVLNVALFAMWQKRKVAEPVTASDEPTTEVPITGGGIFGRFRREKRTSAYGRPVTTND